MLDLVVRASDNLLPLLPDAVGSLHTKSMLVSVAPAVLFKRAYLGCYVLHLVFDGVQHRSIWAKYLYLTEWRHALVHYGRALVLNKSGQHQCSTSLW